MRMKWLSIAGSLAIAGLLATGASAAQAKSCSFSGPLTYPNIQRVTAVHASCDTARGVALAVHYAAKGYGRSLPSRVTKWPAASEWRQLPGPFSCRYAKVPVTKDEYNERGVCTGPGGTRVTFSIVTN